MARRMLEVFEKNLVIERNDEWNRATLCAALLHDVGHGPFSHVFEDLSSSLGIEISHEEYTRRIIRETSLADVLGGQGSELLRNTLSFFETEPGNNQYSRIVSSQLDADRLDFLVRDRYFSGVMIGMIDLEWLFDSLKIDQLPSLDEQVTEYTFVSARKGIPVVEEYLSAYAHMYTNVYFHKTTRAAQHLVQKVLLKLLQNDSFCKKIPKNEPVVEYFKSSPTPSLEQYLNLDDTSIISLLKIISDQDFKDISELATRFFNRQFFKCFEIPKPPGGDPPRKYIGEFCSALKDQNIWYVRDILSGKGYKQFKLTTKNFFKIFWLTTMEIHAQLENSGPALNP